jgi:hypothetical protein
LLAGCAQRSVVAPLPGQAQSIGNVPLGAAAHPRLSTQTYEGSGGSGSGTGSATIPLPTNPPTVTCPIAWSSTITNLLIDVSNDGKTLASDSSIQGQLTFAYQGGGSPYCPAAGAGGASPYDVPLTGSISNFQLNASYNQTTDGVTWTVSVTGPVTTESIDSTVTMSSAFSQDGISLAFNPIAISQVLTPLAPGSFNKAIVAAADLAFMTKESTANGPGCGGADAPLVLKTAKGGYCSCAWELNRILFTAAGIAPLGKNPDRVKDIVIAIVGGRGEQITNQSDTLAGDIAVEGSQTHVGVCANDTCTIVYSNSSSKATFSVPSKPCMFECGPGYKPPTFYRITK